MASNEAMVNQVVFLLQLIVLSCLCCGLWPYVVCSLEFSNAGFNSIDGFFFQKPLDEPNGSIPIWSDQSILLTPDPTTTVRNRQLYNVGRLLYNRSIPFMGDGTTRVVSFATSFTFQILTTTEYGSSGDGVAFTVTADPYVPINSTGRYLGLASQFTSPQISQSQPFFAVEFDTFKNLEPEIADPSASHIGIDINGLKSVATLDTSSNNSEFYPELFLYNNYTFKAWVQYNACSQLIQVWMTNRSTDDQRPPEPCLSAHYDLSKVFKKEMYVGITAASGNNSQGNVLYSWNFSIEDVNRSSEHKLLVLGLALAAAMFCIAAAAGFLAVRRRKLATQRKSEIPRMEMASITMPRYTYKKLKRASQSFSERRKVGEGGFSSVYKGILPDGTEVAVKRLKEGLRMEAEFATEVQIISQIRHRNLLQLQGWCYEKGEALLVYRFMPNGSLDSYLFGQKKGSQLLNSQAKFKVLMGLAAALEYLHGGLGGCVLHRDVKAANVLLTEKFEAMLGDFGLARLITHDQVVTMTAAGTPGYVAPEVVYTGKATDKADVYSFGVLALEVACGRRALDASLDIRLVDWVWIRHQSGNIMDALDPSLLQPYNENEERHELKWRCVLHLGLLCCHPWQEARPTMRQVHQALQEIIILPLPASRPMYPANSYDADADAAAAAAVSSFSSRSLGQSAPSNSPVPSASSLSIPL